MTLKTSLIITGDSNAAQAAVDDLKKSVDNLERGTRVAANTQGTLAASTNVTASSARAAAVAQGAVATANTTVAATGRAAAVAQGAVAVATEVATGAMASFGISAMTVEAILTGGLSLALTAGIGFLTGFAAELFSAGSEAEDAAPKVDKLTEALRRLRKEQANTADIAEIEQKLNGLRDERLKASIAIDRAANTRAGAQDRAAASRRIAELDAEIGGLERSVAMNEAVAKSHEKAEEATTKSTASTRASSAAHRESSEAARAAAAAQKELEADLKGLIDRYDPARKAASDYADELQRIATLAGKGKISPQDAVVYRAQASAAHLGQSLDWGDIRSAATGEQAAIDASGAIDKVVQSINDEIAALSTLNPIERELLEYRSQLLALSPEQRAEAEGRITAALQEKASIEEIAKATGEARRAQEQLGNMAVDAFTAIAVGGQKASDVIDHLGETIAAAAVQATLFGTGPLAAMLGGAVAPASGGSAAGAQSVSADLVGKSVGKSVEGAMDKVFGSKGSFGKTLQNAGLGYAAGGLTGSKTGGALGGAIGGAVGKELLGSALGSLGQFAGPIGAIAGGLLGGAIGGLLKKTKTGAANITSVTQDATLSGNSSSFKAAASGAAGSVQDGLADIAEMLGGAIGAFNVTIGQRHGDWRVRSGTGSLKVAKGATEFDDDQAGAIAYAIQLAVSQGAVTGLSAAVEKAIKSSTDINDALAEALKVQEVEQLLGGIGAELAAQFKSLETQAKERVRIATQYGFDVVAIEKKNAEDRAALMEDMLDAQVGSLQRLVKEMTYGSMFEGSAIEQRDAILKEIEQAKSDVASGKDGAADALAELLQQLNSVSQEAYGSTGQYAADRSMILDLARNEIAKANAEIVKASSSTSSGSSGSDPALATTNNVLNENNDQNARMIVQMEEMNTKLAVIASKSGDPVGDYLKQQRFQKLMWNS
ncbi:hypothetical protein CG471_21755 [Sphingobium sp. IP1]|uniref:hypothetical protein n=1 Tax=Sphingobium sp. IP1 TaxID=2021637 RepID=UPI000C07EBFC|nr:hypothetical protein [Sphingobium sp. IP1]PHP17650.1 hypothetical protein CG471_21755 [Sphingobium sp. IP1]